MSMVTSNFIGRKQELNFLSQWLAVSNEPPILYIHDALKEAEKKGGIGKTWLLTRYKELIEQQHPNVIPVAINFFDIVDRDGIAIAERVAQALRERYSHWQAEEFEKTLQEYHAAIVEKQKAEHIASLRERLADALMNDLRLLQQMMIDSGTFIVLLCDTFEQIEANPITAVLRPGQTFPDTYRSNRIRAIIAGRNDLDWAHQNWVNRQPEVLIHPLSPFNYDEMVEYLQARSEIYDDIHSLPTQTLQALYERTEGRPILVGLVADVLNHRIREPEDLAIVDKEQFEASLVEEINHFKDPGKWVTLAMAHIYHRFDAMLLARLMDWPGLKGIVPRMQYQELVQELPTLSFVRRAGVNAFVLHDEMRRLVNQYCWRIQDENRRIRHELSRLAIGYYTELIAEETDEEKRRSYIVEQLFHELFLDQQSGFLSFKKHFYSATALAQRAFARALLQEFQKFEPDLPNELLRETMLAEIYVLIAEENHRQALEKLEEYEQHDTWVEYNRFDLLKQKGFCYLRLSQYPQATACFEDCLKLDPSDYEKASLLSLQGYIARLQGRYTDAMRKYELALKFQRTQEDLREYANLLNNMGNVLRLLGKLEDALRYCKLALRIRRDLFAHNKVSEYTVGMNLSTLGHIYHTLGELNEEEKAYKEAFDIYNRIGRKGNIASAYNSLGRIWIKKGDLKKARENFQQAMRIAKGVNSEAEIEGHNQLGRLALEQKQWEEAIADFQQAITLARNVGANFQLAENLLYLAQALDDNGQPFQGHIKEAKRIARRNNFSYLLARAGEIQGDMYLKRQEYLSAFKHYGISCRYIADRSALEFDRSLRKLNDTLLDIPSDYLPGAIDSLRSYWSEVGLDEKYPQLSAICKEVSRHMLL